jgi:anaerobic magnesium-protoporphyrin IX monomethyl ester cyclase
MKITLINPAWHYENSIYFGCREAHLPLEFGYAAQALERAGHEALLIDAQIEELDANGIAARVRGFGPEMIVITTAPTYLFWRCAPPELRVPQETLAALAGIPALRVAVGPHGSSTPAAVLAKLGVDLVIRGECEDVIAALADAPERRDITGLAWLDGEGRLELSGGLAEARFIEAPALRWPDGWIARHHHHHHQFDLVIEGPGAEIEASRGCPYACSFCAKIDFRDKYRRRALAPLLDEIDGLIAQGAKYLYFIDEIFLPRMDLLEALASRDIRFGIQTRIDLWKPHQLDLLGAAGCVSIEAGVESLTPEGRDQLAKKCRLDTDELTELLIRARRSVPFVQANLIRVDGDDADQVAEWRARLAAAGVWANDPVPLFPYPSAPDYRQLFGLPDDLAWERAHAHYLAQFDHFSTIQDERPAPLPELERQ